MTGEEYPCPGTADFHVIFFSSFHTIGMPFASECPWPSGPRNCGQSADQRAGDERKSRRDNVINRMALLAQLLTGISDEKNVAQIRICLGTLKVKGLSPSKFMFQRFAIRIAVAISVSNS